MTKKHIIFLELTQGVTHVDLPVKFTGDRVKASLIHWVLGGTLSTNRNYVQVEFTNGGPESNFVGMGARTMIQVPCTPLDRGLTLPLGNGKTLQSKFTVEVYGEGGFPERLTFNGTTDKLLLWILVEVEDIVNSLTYFS